MPQDKKDRRSRHCIHDKGLVCGMPETFCTVCSPTTIRIIDRYGPYKPITTIQSMKDQK